MITQRPNLHDMLKAAMEGTIAKADINAEAARQIAHHRGESEEKTASAASPEHYSTEHITKVAAALDYIAEQMKVAEGPGPGQGPGALRVMPATSTGSVLEAGQSGEAIHKDQPPMNPPTQGEEVQVGNANTGMQTNDDMMHGEQPVSPIKNQSAPLKTASAAQGLFEANLARLGLAKTAGGKKPVAPAAKPAKGKAPIKALRKMAEDAINPAQISAGKEVPPDASEAGKDVPTQPSDVRSQASSMLGSNDAAINYTKGQAKADPKSDVNQVLNQPALTRAGDSVLHEAFDHTEAAGTKFSSAKNPVSADGVKVAAARVLLSKLMEKVAEDKSGKKEKKSMMGGAPTSPSAASGFRASSLG